ncbi:MAG TPA: GNAT family N-acetyltransferase [Microvirga sp.]|jgi:ribosomal-protein-alanine N-acetyltransferase|nr:GNAT family N-acetyltransferase [Microvirga sp.]
MEGERVLVRRVRAEDGRELVRANLASIAVHEPWVIPFRDEAGFQIYLETCDGERKIGFVLRERQTRRVVGVVNLSEIVRGAFQSAYLGYFGMSGFQGRGLMREGLSLVIDHAFGELALHRIEANIQPGNTRSLALARRLGFRKEGFSPRYLQIGGAWRDHERWAILEDEWAGPRL